VPLPNDPNVIDPHYQIISSPNNNSYGPDAHVEDETVFPIVSGPWYANSATSKWIAPEFNTVNSLGGDYAYQTTFDLTGLLPETATISGYWASDNAGGDILLNGQVVSSGNAQFGSLTQFVIPPGSPFVDGLNTLEFRLNNASQGYTALRVEGLQGRAISGIIPEPAAVAVWAGLLGLALCVRRRKQRA